jgi:predicted O-methyltransferase YrrM
MDTLQKIPASKRFLRAAKIILLNTVFFPFRIKKLKNLFNHIYELDPLPPLHDKIKEVLLDEIFPDIHRNRIILRDLESKYGSMTLEEIYSVAALVKKLNPETIFEFGTFIGVTTLQMALNADERTKIYTLNLPSTETDTKYSIGHSEEEINLPNLQPGNRFKDSEMSGKINQLYGDSASYDFSEYYGKIDFILVDASHEYNYVKSDTENSFKMLKEGGTLVWHDYPNAPGVYNYLNEIASELKIYHIKDTHLTFTLNFNGRKA